MQQSNMPTRWKLKEFLVSEEITPYRLAQQTAGRLSINAIYNLVDEEKPIKSLKFETLDVLLPSLSRMTDKKVKLSDILEWEE